MVPSVRHCSCPYGHPNKIIEVNKKGQVLIKTREYPGVLWCCSIPTFMLFYSLLFFLSSSFFSFSTARRYLSCQRNCLLLRLFKTCRKLNFLCCNYLPFSLQSKIDFPAYWAIMVTQFVKNKFLMMKLIANVVWKISWDFLPTTWK